MINKKYIELLLKRCLKLDESTPLFISYNKVNKDYITKIVEYAKDMNIKDIYLNETDSYYIHDLLKSMTIDEIENNEEFSCKIWDEYAQKDAAFLMFDTYLPNVMDDIEKDKLSAYSKVKSETKPIYKDRQLKSELAWTIAVLPNEMWAKDLFPNEEDALSKFWEVLEEICLVNQPAPIKAWDNLLEDQEKTIKKLDDLKIKKLYLSNSLGTNLEVELAKDARWQSAASNKWIVNLPSYEIFTAPNYKKTSGVVFSSKPLIYNGVVIDNFNIKFEEGKVVEYDAKSGKDMLKKIIDTDEFSAYLGEIALVNYNSPISNTNLVFKTTLLDENASCHIALGSAFNECVKNWEKHKKEELQDKYGLNPSSTHVDFMIGTKDLLVKAETKDGLITIMENGNIII